MGRDGRTEHRASVAALPWIPCTGYSTYVKDRLTGFDGQAGPLRAADMLEFPEYARRTSRVAAKRPACTGPVTYKKNDELRRAARDCPIDQLVVETDGPYLSPEPVRAQRINEPAFVAHIAACIAKEKGVSIEAFDEATTRNARELFGF